MSRPVADYLLALAVCLALAIGYRVTVVPLLRPGPLPDIAWRDTRDDLREDRFDGIFPAGSWQLDEPRSLRAEWGTLLFKERVQVAPDQWKVAPVTVILAGSDGSPAAEGGGSDEGGPVIMQASEGAIVQFEEPLNLMRAASPKIKGGQLIGEVRIFNQPAEGSAAGARRGPVDPARDAIDLRTRNVRIDARQIRSAEAVELRIGAALMKGRDFTMQLAGGGTLPTDVDSPREVLDTLELIYLDELTVPLPEGPLWQPLDRPPPAGPARLEVQCQGSVVFDFATFSLRLSDHVRIAHLWSSGSDSFDCARLDLQLADPEQPTGDAAATSASPLGRQLGEIRAVLRRISATGFPLVARLPSLDTEVRAEELDLDFDRGFFRLAAAQQPIRLRHRGFTFEVPGVEYRFDVSRPEQPGSLVSSGAGQLGIDLPEIALRRLTWQRELKLLPVEQGHQLQLHGDVSMRTADGGAAAEELLLLLAAVPAAEATVAPPADGSADEGPPLRTVSQRATSGRGESSATTWQARKLWARGDVRVDLPQLAAETEALFVEFDHVPAASPASSEADAGEESRGPSLFPATGPRQRQYIVGPDGKAVEARPPVAKSRPLLRGERINANLVVRDGELISHDVSIERRVTLEHQLPTERGSLPLTYHGDSLRLILGRSEQLVQIAGKPARIELGDGYFSGPLVILDGRRNSVLIRDRGTFQMPSDVMPRGGAEGVRWRQPPRCEFLGELAFDGQVVEIRDEVQLSGKLATANSPDVWHVRASAPLMKVVLDRAVRVTEPTAARQAGVELVSLIGGARPVELVAERYSADQQQLTGRHVLVNPRLNLLARTGQLSGEGPGWYRSWTPSAGEGAMRSVAPSGSLLATHLMFNGGLEGDLARQELSFYSGVRVGMAAVRDWRVMLDAAAMTQLELNQGTVDCDRLALGRAADAPRRSTGGTVAGVERGPPWEMRAEGGVAFRFLTERGLLDGTAARAAYDSRRDLFVLDGIPGRPAVVRQRDPQTGRGMQMGFSQVALTPDLSLENLDMRATITGGQMQAPARGGLRGGSP